MDQDTGANGEHEAAGEAVKEEVFLVSGTVRRASFIPEFRDEDCRMDIVWDPEADINLKKSALVGGRPPIKNFETSSLSEDAIEEEMIEYDVVSGVNATCGDLAQVEEEQLSSERVDRRVSVQSLNEMLREENMLLNPIINGIPEVDDYEGDLVQPVNASFAFSGNLRNVDSNRNNDLATRPERDDHIANLTTSSDLSTSTSTHANSELRVNPEVTAQKGETVDKIEGTIAQSADGPSVTKTCDISVTVTQPEPSSVVTSPQSEGKSKPSKKSKSKGVLGVFKRSPKPKHQTKANNTGQSENISEQQTAESTDKKSGVDTNGKKSGFFSFGSRGKGKSANTQPSADKTSISAVNTVEATPTKVPPSVNHDISVQSTTILQENEVKGELSPDKQESNTNEQKIPTENVTVAVTAPSINLAQPEVYAPGSPVKSETEIQSFEVINGEQVKTSISNTVEVSPGQPSAVRETALAQPSGQAELSKYVVVVAIDFGTAFSGYAFSFVRDPESIHMMSRWEGGDPGILNQKTPSILLLNPEGQFHSFGFTARNLYHDLSPEDAVRWLYFDKFKMSLYKSSECNRQTMIEAANGKKFPAIEAVKMTLTYFKGHALQELTEQCGTEMTNDDVRWIVTVPAIWNAAAKQFMRQAAYEAGLATASDPDQLVIALEPEAASVHIRKLRLHMLVPEKPYATLPLSIKRKSLDPTSLETVSSQFKTVTRYMVVDCGGGTVDIAVHDVNAVSGVLQEVYKTSGGAHGSSGIDADFETLLGAIFGEDFIKSYRYKRPSGWVALMMAFESRKRAANPLKVHQPSNIALPFSFIEYHRKTKNMTVEKAISDFGESELRWSSQGMLRMSPEAMKILFQTTVDGIVESVATVFNKISGIQNIFLVGGLSESAIVQHAIREKFGSQSRIIVPQEANLAVLKGAVCYGLDPGVVAERRSKLTYGAAVLHRFIPGKHPQSKLIQKDGINWCKDVFDHFVVADQIVRREEPVVRSYTPASASQSHITVSIYSSEHTDVQYVTDPRVTKCATVVLDLTRSATYGQTRRQIQTFMTFAETEIKVTAMDTTSGEKVYASIDFFRT